MKAWLIVSLAVLMTTVCQARVGENAGQIEARYGKPIKNATPLKPATSAKIYQKGDLGYYVGYIDNVAVYEIVQEVEDDGDFGEDQVSQAHIDASLKANDTDGGWTEVKDAKDKSRHWKSANGKLLANYDRKYKKLMIETAEFHEQHLASMPPRK